MTVEEEFEELARGLVSTSHWPQLVRFAETVDRANADRQRRAFDAGPFVAITEKVFSLPQFRADPRLPDLPAGLDPITLKPRREMAA